MSSRLVLSVFALAAIAVPAPADWLGVWDPRPLTTVQQVRHLTPTQSEEVRPVKLVGVITHLDPQKFDFFLQDGTAGIYIRPTPFAKELAAGDHIELLGTTDPGAFSPCVFARSVRQLGKALPPDPQPYNLSIEDSRWLDAQWVQAWGVVQQVRSIAGTTQIDLYSTHGSATLVVPGEELAGPGRALIGEAVSVRGVCVSKFRGREIAGPAQILLSAMPVPISYPLEGSGVRAAPPRMIDHLLQFSPTPHPGSRRVKIAGVITATPLPGVIVIQDATGGATVWTDDAREVPIGTRVEAYGLLRVGSSRIGLTRASLTVLNPAPLPAPIPARSDELAAGTRDAVLVRLEGRAEEVRDVEGWTAVVMADGAFRFEAFVPGLPDVNGLRQSVELGSRIAVVGVPLGFGPGGKAPAGAGMFLRSAAAISVLEPAIRAAAPAASWWTLARVASVVVGLLVVGLIGAAWLLALRVQVRRSTANARRQIEERAKLKGQLRDAAKMEAVGQLTGGIAHDFNNLLTVINGYSELLADEVARGGGRVAEFTDDIRRAGERAAGLTSQLLAFSRKGDGLIAAVDLNSVVADAVRMIDRLIGERIKIETDSAPGLPAVRGEPGLILQILINLAVNAKDAMPTGGTLRLTTSIGQGRRGGGRGGVRLTVSDTGTGMSDDVKARIFEPFFTTKPPGAGTGLGLSNVNAIVAKLGGKIGVDSAVGGGTTFHIDFRVYGDPGSDSGFPAVPTPLPVALRSPSVKLMGVTVLLVEDSEMVRNLLASGLIAEGATVLAADRPETALRVLAAHPGRIDLLVTDVVMPEMSGLALAERIRAVRPETRIVFMSGYAPDEVLRQGVFEEQVEFLQKPFTPDTLTVRLVRVLQGGRLPASRD